MYFMNLNLLFRLSFNDKSVISLSTSSLLNSESEYFSSLPESAQILSSASPLVINLLFIFQYDLPLILEDYCFGGSADVER